VDLPASVRVSRVPTYSTKENILARRLGIFLGLRPYKYKVSETSRTGLSPSMVQLSNCFCSPRRFVDLMQENGSSCFRYGNLVCTRAPYWLFVMSQPLLDIRLPTYLFTSKLANKNLKSLGCCGFARHYYRNLCLISLPRPTKMFQFRRLPTPYPIYSDKCDWT
jgi:hypothetical protein